MLNNFFLSASFHHIFCFVLLFTISIVLIPIIRTTVLKLGLIVVPDNRSSHVSPVPTFGGIVFYISYIIVLFFCQKGDVNYLSFTLLISISVLFFTGLVDDYKGLSPGVKFFLQFLGVAILMFQSEFRILSLHGFMGFYEIPTSVSVIGSMFFMLGLINAFNLLDGIDGLTAVTGIIVASFYGYVFYFLENFYYLHICIATIASLLAFLRFNFSSKKKVFMGDTGSLVIGLVLGLLSLKIMTLENEAFNCFSFKRAQLPLFLIGVLFVPILDTLRVMFLRLSRSVSMFKPDRNHIHHLLVDFGFTHRRASFLIGFINIIVGLTMFFVTQIFTASQSLFILSSLNITIILFLFIINKSKKALRLKIATINLLKKILKLFKPLRPE
jgi:UDP-GlcNAc:undecaprenyl-phosphate/decaprenyl-phosphate GlcNAc-1-phosphate transferase